MTVDNFLAAVGEPCIRAMLTNGGFASVRLAQIALETGWLEAIPHDIETGQNSYNLTGVKGVGPAGSVKTWTKEWTGEEYIDVLAQFRAYHSYEECIMLRDEIFDWDNYSAYRAAQTPEEACWALQNAPMPYATDPDYAEKLISIIHANGFKRLDDEARERTFPDVPTNAWYAEAVKSAFDAGLMVGDVDGLFHPDQPITRAEMATIIDRLLRQ